MMGEAFQIYIKTLEAQLAREREESQDWPLRIKQFERRVGKLEADCYQQYVKNEDLTKENAALKKANEVLKKGIERMIEMLKHPTVRVIK